ncbi:hypothetical protein B0A48_07414 [Cryoendolithus antarcticus]|uniref:Phytase-like domain-containing protein n=1 Tax=Cryoendolithus antarcticus TaxID=1507870 RepID=A0A1V8T8I0_9PEZI|nr:hypothetical protein B0A48_07414 [Cryoendolithus antarcticus]
MHVHSRQLAALCGALLSPSLVTAAPSSPSSTTSSTPAVSTTTCNGQTYIYEELAGYGYLPSNARDNRGDTLGGIGSSIAFDKDSWKKLKNGSYTGTMWALPDRGWNTEGTLNYQNRVQKIKVLLNPNEGATVASPSAPNLILTYLDTVAFTDPKGVPTSGLDANVRGPYLSFPGIGAVDVPSANYTGDGFGGNGTGGTRVSFDSEGLVIDDGGNFWVSDEYGPYIYQFNKKGKMIQAIRPPDAFIPLRNGSESFSANSPPRYDPSLAPIPGDNPTGRDNNQGLEGLTIDPKGKKLYALLQSSTNQDGGPTNRRTRNSRFLVYDLKHTPARYEAEYVVQLAQIQPNNTQSKIARQSEIHYISDTQFLVLARDSGAGRGQSDTTSLYRHVDVFDISNATNVKGPLADCYTCRIASAAGVLNSTITPATYCSWLDFNVNSQLNRFGVHNGGAQDDGLLNEKWESIALLPVDPDDSKSEEYFLFSLSDNDFVTQDGYMNGGKLKYADESGFNLLNQALVFKVQLPKKAKALVG